MGWLDDLSELSGSLFTSRDDKTYNGCATHMNDEKVFFLFLSKSFREIRVFRDQIQIVKI